MTRFILTLLALGSVFSAAVIAGSGASLEDIQKGDHRKAENKARDEYRNPVKTLEFFGLKPDMKVVEITPGGGWYTEIIAPYLKAEGHYIAAIFNEDTGVEFYKKANERFRAKVGDAAYGNVETIQFDPPVKAALAADNSVDMVLTFRNVHNWMGRGNAAHVLKSFYDALKPGGVLGIVEHRAKAGSEQDPKGRNGYVTEEYVVKMAEHAGFILVASSEINANPKDTTDHPKGVWTLPPRLAVKEEAEKYKKIGESDRMTLKFVKP